MGVCGTTEDCVDGIMVPRSRATSKEEEVTPEGRRIHGRGRARSTDYGGCASSSERGRGCGLVDSGSERRRWVELDSTTTKG